MSRSVREAILPQLARYEDGADDNTGLGMWSLEVSASSTVYLDAARTWHFAALAAWETHSEREDSDIRVGDLPTIEGGLGKSWMDGGLSVGIAYFAQCDRKRWRTRVELANAIFEYLEIFHNRRRRHSSLGMASPVKYELRHAS